jgi:hypothetical protein
MTASDVEFHDIQRGADVIVRGRRVPMLEAHTKPGGKLLLVFDRRISLELDAGTYEPVIDFLATVMENVMNPDCGRTFNRLREGVLEAALGSAREET